MSNEKEKISPSHLLPKVSFETVNNLDNRFAPFAEENQKKAISENESIFLFLAKIGLPIEGAYLIYIPLRMEAENQKLRLPQVSKKTIDSYFESPLWGKINEFSDESLEGNGLSGEKISKLKGIAKDTEFVLPTIKLPQENPHLMTYLEWHCEVMKENGLSFSNINKIKAAAHFTYEILSQQAERDSLQTSFNL